MFREVDAKGIFLPSIRIAEHPKKGYICIATKDFYSFNNVGENLFICSLVWYCILPVYIFIYLEKPELFKKL